MRTTFTFDDFRLVAGPADYLDDADELDHYGKLFMPNNEVLTVGPGGAKVERSNGESSEQNGLLVSGKKFREEV